MKNLKRETVYLIIIIVSLASVVIRIQAVKAARGKAIVSFYEEWKKAGKPVEVRVIKTEDVPVYAQFTVRIIDGRLARGFVTGEVKNALREGQEIYDPADKSVVCARLKSIGAELDMDAGMFPVEIEFNKPRDPGVALVVRAHTTTLHNVLAVSNEVLDIAGDEYFVWKDENGFAKKGKVVIRLRNGYGAIISEGLQSGDKVIFSGQSMLEDNDRLRVVNAGKTDKKELTQ
ncbi:MAG: hypothetical protein WC510_02905 [Candidatus Omnitrophota bacterium]